VFRIVPQLRDFKDNRHMGPLLAGPEEGGGARSGTLPKSRRHRFSFHLREEEGKQLRLINAEDLFGRGGGRFGAFNPAPKEGPQIDKRRSGQLDRGQCRLAGSSTLRRGGRWGRKTGEESSSRIADRLCLMAALIASSRSPQSTGKMEEPKPYLWTRLPLRADSHAAQC